MAYSWVDALREIGKQLRTEFTNGLASKADTTHTHDDYVTKETGYTRYKYFSYKN